MIFTPLGQYFKINRKFKRNLKLEKFSDHCWHLLYYTISFSIGMSVVLNTEDVIELPFLFLKHPSYVSEKKIIHKKNLKALFLG